MEEEYLQDKPKRAETEAPAKPVVAGSDFADMHLFMYGYQQWQMQQEGEDLTLADYRLPPGIVVPTEPISASSHIDMMGRMFSSGYEGRIADAPADLQIRMHERLESLGLESFMEDGYLSAEELVVAACEVGKGVDAKDPGKFNPNEEAMQSASKLLEQVGVDDPDGSMARGLAVQIESAVYKVNEGLGLAVEQAQPEVAQNLRADLEINTSPKPF